ncbi:MAG TPA: 30S ribosomal protein S8 [Candidatus Saccharimonadales bacterium]|nr:30S ribosomal protein S8 [Candidatus Saccharimonadales bacterium]
MSTITSDPIADMLTRIRNAVALRKSDIVMPHSKIKEQIARVLKDERLIENFSVSGSGIDKLLKVQINEASANPRITEIVRMSKPGRRQYSRSDQIPKVKNGRGLVIISTSSGLMTGDKAQKKGIGGELICKVY